MSMPGDERAVAPDTVQLGTVGEAIRAQLPYAHAGHTAVANAFNCSKDNTFVPMRRGKVGYGRQLGSDAFIGSLDAMSETLDGWLTDERLATASALQQSGPNVTLTLHAKPKVLADARTLRRMVDRLGEVPKGWPYSSPSDLYDSVSFLGSACSDGSGVKYNAEQLSGATPQPNGGTEFGIVVAGSELFASGSGIWRWWDYRERLEELKTAHPSLKVPSVLGALSYGQAAEAQGIRAQSVLHFNLPQIFLPRLGHVIPLTGFTADGSTYTPGLSPVGRRDLPAAVVEIV